MNKNIYVKAALSGLVVIAILVTVYFYFNSKKQSSEVSSNNEILQVNSDVQDKAEEPSKQLAGNKSAINGEDNTAVKIKKSEITSNAKFYPYKIDGINMELLAVKATDGTIRTALNTCQVCYDSGRGYYKQEGDYLVCQNCGNRFHIDQIEKIKGGCNPVPVLEEDKQDKGDYIAVSKDFMESKKDLFSNWQKG